jgi:hypothetical protein
MKKFIITLLILVILGGVAFFFGWAQFTVPPGQYGVIISKTHGIDSQIVRSGEFRWVWYKLIPTNVKIAVFNLEHMKHPINFNSILPSGETYASFVGVTRADFSWSYKGEIAFSLKPEMLVEITKKQNLKDQENLDEYMQRMARDIEFIVLRTLGDTDNIRIEQIMSGKNDAVLEQEVRDRFPEIRDFSLAVLSVKLPDFTLYRQIRLLYEEYLASQRQAISSIFSRMAESHIETQLRFEELERYGDLLTRFPILLNFLELENEINRNQ